MFKTVKTQSVLTGGHYVCCCEEFWAITAWLTYSHCLCYEAITITRPQEMSVVSHWCCLFCIINSSLFPVIAHGNSQHFSTLNRPGRWCHYNTDTHPILWNCHVWRHSPIIICAESQSSALATESTPGNRLQCLVGALSKLREYLCIMSNALGPIKRQKSGEWERQWQEWIKSLIPSFTWVSRDLGSQCTCVCLCVIEICRVVTYSRPNIYQR